MQRFKAITRTEVVVIVVIIFILLGLLIPASHSSGIYYIIRSGDLDLLRKQVQKEKPGPESFPGFLNLAIRYEHLPICQYFIEELHTPLEEKHFVSGLETQNVEILLYLLENGVPVDVNAKIGDGRSVQDLINDLLNDINSKEEDENGKKLKELLQPYRNLPLPAPSVSAGLHVSPRAYAWGW